MIALEPGRMGFDDNDASESRVKTEVKELIKQGLRGGLVAGNLLTGSKYVELQYEEGVTSELTMFSDHLVIPTLQSQFDQILKKFGRVMDKLYELPLEPVVKSADVTLNQLTKTLAEYRQTAKELNILLKQSADENLVASIEDALKSFEKLTENFSEGSATNDEIQNVLKVMRETLEKLAPLLTQLNQKPNSLIFSDQKNQDVEPKGQR
jgi:paraquat-inducible protein B